MEKVQWSSPTKDDEARIKSPIREEVSGDVSTSDKVRVIGRVKSRLALQRLTWQGQENASIYVCLVLMAAYAVCIAAYGMGRPELRQSVAFFA